MKCPHCSYESYQNFDKCPVCGAAVYHPYANYYQPPNPYGSTQPRKKSGAEIFAIITAIVLAVISPIAAFIIFVSTLTVDTYDYSFNDYDDYDYSYSSDHASNSFDKNNFANPTAKDTPVEFEEKLFSFSNGYIETKYEVTLKETYRGDAAVKMLGSAKIPELNSMQEIYLAEFNISIIEQDNPAYITLTSFSATAYDSNKQSLSTLSLIDYKDNTQLLMEGESGIRWIAFVVDKDDESPYIAWYDQNKYEFFRNTEASISDASAVIEGQAVE